MLVELVVLILMMTEGGGSTPRTGKQSSVSRLGKIEPYNVSVSDKPIKLKLEPLSFYRCTLQEYLDNNFNKTEYS